MFTQYPESAVLPCGSAVQPVPNLRTRFTKLREDAVDTFVAFVLITTLDLPNKVRILKKDYDKLIKRYYTPQIESRVYLI